MEEKKHAVLSMADVPFVKGEFGRLEDIAVVRHEKPDPGKLLELIGDYDAYFCSLEVRVTREIIEAGEKLKAIVTPSTGLDHIDLECAEEKGIAVISLKNDYDVLKNITATAELAFGLLLAAVRRIPWGFDAAKAGWWARDRFRGTQLSSKTMGILGYGRLGEMTAEYARAFRMEVIACDIRRISSPGIEQVEFEELLRRSDVLSLHLHLNPRTRGIIGREAFSRMKDGIVIINTSRGGLIDEGAFLEALESGKVAAAGLDVIDGEWRKDLDRHPLIAYAREHENLLVTPHVGGVTYESQRTAYSHSIEKLGDFLRGKRTPGERGGAA